MPSLCSTAAALSDGEADATIGPMSQDAAEAAAHAQVRAIIARDFGAAIRAMTPEGLAKAMEVGNTTWHVVSYDLALQAREGEDYVFQVSLHTDAGPLVLLERFREVDGQWKMVDIERTGG